jgi:hypothetical protein
MFLSIELSIKRSIFIILEEAIDSEESKIKEQNDPLLDWDFIL